MTPEQFVDAVHEAMATPGWADGLHPSVLLAGKGLAVQRVLDQYRDELPHVTTTSTMEVALPVFKELTGQ